MHLRTHMMRDKANYTLAIRGREPLPSVGETIGQAIDPQPAIGIEHDLNDGRVIEPGRDCRTKGRTKHPRAARGGFCPE
jgi:hypothetical protein